MNRSALLVSVVVVAFATVSVVACSGEILPVAENAGDGGLSSSSSDGGGLVGENAACCPRDSTLAGCMHLGGPKASGCGQTCDFFCSTSWRVETDSSGCEVWRWDTRAPAAGESSTCIGSPDAGATDCTPGCGANEVCRKTQQQGGAFIAVDDAGACPAGRHPSGDHCDLDPAFECVAKPSACAAGQLDCTCASDVCGSPYFCQSAQGSQVNCLCQVP